MTGALGTRSANDGGTAGHSIGGRQRHENMLINGKYDGSAGQLRQRRRPLVAYSGKGVFNGNLFCKDTEDADNWANRRHQELCRHQVPVQGRLVVNPREDLINGN